MATAENTSPSAEQVAAEKQKLHTAIKAKFNNLVDVIEAKFFFKTVENKELGTKTRRPTVEQALHRPSVEGVVSILEGGDEKQIALLLEACGEIVLGRARDYLNDNENATEVPLELLTWEAISKIPPKERRGGGIAKEQWEAFQADYCAVMPGATGKTPEQVANAAKILVARFQPVKNVKAVLKMLQGQLGIYANTTPNGEQFTDVLSFLMEKVETLLQADEAALLNNL